MRAKRLWIHAGKPQVMTLASMRNIWKHGLTFAANGTFEGTHLITITSLKKHIITLSSVHKYPR